MALCPQQKCSFLIKQSKKPVVIVITGFTSGDPPAIRTRDTLLKRLEYSFLWLFTSVCIRWYHSGSSIAPFYIFLCFSVILSSFLEQNLNMNSVRAKRIAYQKRGITSIRHSGFSDTPQSLLRGSSLSVCNQISCIRGFKIIAAALRLLLLICR